MILERGLIRLRLDWGANHVNFRVGRPNVKGQSLKEHLIGEGLPDDRVAKLGFVCGDYVRPGMPAERSNHWPDSVQFAFRRAPKEGIAGLVVAAPIIDNVDLWQCSQSASGAKDAASDFRGRKEQERLR